MFFWEGRWRPTAHGHANGAGRLIASAGVFFFIRVSFVGCIVLALALCSFIYRAAALGDLICLSALISPPFFFWIFSHFGQLEQMGGFNLLVFWLSFLCLAISVYVTHFLPPAFVGCREMEEDQSAMLVAEGAIKSVKLSLSTEEEIVSCPSLVVLSTILAYRHA